MCVLRISWGKSWINLNTSFHTLSLGFLTWEILSVWFSFVIPILRLAITKDYICVICKAFKIFKWWVFFDINRFHLIGFLWTLQQEKRRGCSYWGSAVSGGWHLWKHFWNLSSELVNGHLMSSHVDMTLIKVHSHQMKYKMQNKKPQMK